MSDDSPPDMPEDVSIPQHRSMLFLGVRVWNKWRADNPDIEPKLRLCYIRDKKFAGANLAIADLREADFRGSDLTEANFAGADLRGASLEGTRLSGSNFEGADLRMANLSFANLRRTNVRGADLSNTLYIEQEQIEMADGDRRTKLPPGLTYPDHWDKEPDNAPENVADPAPASGAKPSLPDSPSPISMDWNAEGKITVVPPQERPPAHGLSPARRDLLAQALTAMAADLANHIRSGNSDQNIAKRLDTYAGECAKGGATLNILRLDSIVRTLRRLVRRDTDALSAIDAEEFSVFEDDHDQLTRYYPDFEDDQRAKADAPDNIPAPPDVDLAKLLREPPGPEIFDASVADAIDDFLPQDGNLPSQTDVAPAETKSRKITLMGIVRTIWKTLTDIPTKIVGGYSAIEFLISRLQPLFDWLMTLL